eukprot:m.8171 g.8171  ORF g.8171 m.8171 type:complete len:58 (+) comp20396_c0_seq1:50-223(+)
MNVGWMRQSYRVAIERSRSDQERIRLEEAGTASDDSSSTAAQTPAEPGNDKDRMYTD